MSKKSDFQVLETEPQGDKHGETENFQTQTFATPIDKRVGMVVRKMRQERGLTLADISVGSSLTPGTLSRIENGQSSASLEVLERLGQTLGVSLSSLMNEIDKPQGSAQLIKKKDQLEVVRTGTKFGHNYKLLFYQRGPSQLFEPFLIEMDRESEEYPKFQHPGTEFIYMLKGSMHYQFGNGRYLIEPGDAFTFSGEVEHGPAELVTKKVLFISIINHQA